MASRPGTVAPRYGTSNQDDIVEIALLLPVQQVEALVKLSKSRNQSIGQILRGLIDEVIADEG